MTYDMTLSSHPGKALVLSDYTAQYEGRTVNYFHIGEASKAGKVFVEKKDNCFYIMLDNKRNSGFDVAFGEYKEGT